ncbi:MAG: gamma-glutamyltransferase, partial [Proteobacteria bacterium]|nr:gamma-glutamyltransferase [Pseudomonadota bacterium]
MCNSPVGWARSPARACSISRACSARATRTIVCSCNRRVSWPVSSRFPPRTRNERTSGVPSFTYDFPYASKKLPIFAENVVASSQHLAATAGLRMLAKGGNAVDAAVATAIAITVLEPTMNG